MANVDEGIELPQRRWWLPWHWPRNGMQVLQPGEAERLSLRIREKVLEETGSRAEDSQRRTDAFNDWLRLRFHGPLVRDASAGPAFGKAATAIGVTTIAAGLGSSALANSSDDAATTAVLVLGILIGVLGAINQIWRPSQRSVARYQAAFALRQEGWDFLHDRGRYERFGEPKERVDAFIDEVRRIHRAVESVDEATSPSQSGG